MSTRHPNTGRSSRGRLVAARLTGVPIGPDDVPYPVIGGLIWSNPDRPVWWQWTRSALTLGAITASTLSSLPHSVLTGTGLAILLLCGICLVARLPILLRTRDPLLALAAQVTTGLAGVILAVLAPGTAAIAFAAIAVINATELWSIASFLTFAVGLSLIYLVGEVARGRWDLSLAVGLGALAAAVLLGLVRRQSAELAAEARQVRAEQGRTAALQERARIAREIHDVLAHSLSALAVQLETADALLESGRNQQAHVSVLRASRLAREGLAETRRAIGALRGETLPLPELLAALAAEYRTDQAGSATVRVEGTPRDLRPDVGLALYRITQEAITNVRKHAPGAPVTVLLAYGPDGIGLDIVNAASPRGDRPLASSGGGYGLTGLRERAELAGGRLSAGPNDRSGPDSGDASAGPDGTGWRVSVRIPA